MDRIRIVGGNKLNGTIPISGAKNAALPLMIAGLLTEETLILDNVPRLADVAQLQRILGNHGVDITSVGKRPGDHEYQGQTLHISAADIIDTTAPYELVSRMRASFWVIAPLLARMHEARVSLPGGCAIGTRPVDLLIMALEKLGAEHRHRRRLCGGQGARRPEGRCDRFSQGHGQRHPCRHDGGDAGQGHHCHQQCGLRAGNRRCRRLPQQDGRADRGRRHAAHRGRGRAPSCMARATPCCRTGSRPAPMRWRWR